MSIKEKVQQLVQQVEADKAAELQRLERERLRLAVEAQELVYQREILSKVNLEKGRKILDSLGVKGVMKEVFSELKEVDLEVELCLREGKIKRIFALGKTPTNLLTKTISLAPGLTAEVHMANTVGYFVEKIRREGEMTVQLGIELEIDDPGKIWITAAKGPHPFQAVEDVKENLLLTDDSRLLENMEIGIAKHIVNRRHLLLNSNDDTGWDSYGW